MVDQEILETILNECLKIGIKYNAESVEGLLNIIYGNTQFDIVSVVNQETKIANFSITPKALTFSITVKKEQKTG